MFVERRGNPVTREEYDNLLRRVQALEEQSSKSQIKQVKQKKEVFDFERQKPERS